MTGRPSPEFLVHNDFLGFLPHLITDSSSRFILEQMPVVVEEKATLKFVPKLNYYSRYINLRSILVCLFLSLHVSVVLRFGWEKVCTNILAKLFTGLSWHHGTNFIADCAAEPHQALCHPAHSQNITFRSGDF